MDCEKFEPLLLDELYEELDELTSAAVKRHVSGCARCASILNGMRSTRRAVTLPIEPVPAGLEDRILAAAKEAQKVVPIKGRFGRVVSVAGNWAMRPQTAMAAVFLLMIGTSAFLIRSRDYRSKDSAVSVTVAGAPAPQAQATPLAADPVDDPAAHGPSSPVIGARPPMPAASVASAGDLDRMTNGAGRDEESPGNAVAALAAPAADYKAQAYAPAAVATATTSPITNAGGPAAGAPAGDSMIQAPGAYAKRASKDIDAYALGAAAFQARNYAEATKQFDQAAKGGDQNAELWAAESVREGQGCGVAVGRYDTLAKKAAGVWIGNEASLREARCQIALGQSDAAKTRLNALLQVPSHQAAAQQELNNMNAVASKGGGASAGGRAAGAPARKSAAPARPSMAPRENADPAKKATTDAF